MDMYQKRKKRQEMKNSENKKETQNQININWYPGHMAKTRRLIKENLNLIDIVIELVDSRIPFSSRIKDLDDIIKNKPKLMIMTKKDLCDMKETNKWIKYYESFGYKVLCMDIEHEFNSKQIFNIINEIMQEKNDKRLEKGMRIKKPRCLVIGVPNVGKSTLINRIAGSKVVGVGNKPGVTTNLNWIRVNPNIELLDSPGLLWPKIDEGNVAYNLASFTAIREEILPIYDVTIYILTTLLKYYPEILKERYNLEKIDDPIEAFDIIGKKRGALGRRAETDYDKVMTIIMNDFKQGYVKGVTFDRYEK